MIKNNYLTFLHVHSFSDYKNTFLPLHRSFRRVCRGVVIVNDSI